MPQPDNTFALVTGASSGIGLALARCFAKDGHGLIVSARQGPELERVAEALRLDGAPTVHVAPADLARPEGPAELFAAVEKLGVPVEFLVNNAGAGVFGDFAMDTDLYDELRLIQLNVTSMVHLTKLFAPKMVERGSGRILITSSLAAKAPSPNLTIYSATKAFGHAFAEGLAVELKDKDVTVTALMPDATDTDFFRSAGMAETAIGQAPKADPAQVAAMGYEALMKGKDHVVAPTKSKLTAALANVLPDSFVAGKAKAQ